MSFLFKANYEKENEFGARGTQCLVLIIHSLVLSGSKGGKQDQRDRFIN